MKKGAGSKKGGAFEREICKRLGLWMTDGESDDTFWRSPVSGGRASVRQKKGKSTSGQWGDLISVDERGLPFTDLFIVEVKRGYGQNSTGTIADLLDCTSTICMWQKWINKVEKQCEVSGVPFWMIISKRNRRVPIVCISGSTVDVLCGNFIYREVYGDRKEEKQAAFSADLMDNWRMQRQDQCGEILKFYLLDEFLDSLSPEVLRTSWEARKK